MNELKKLATEYFAIENQCDGTAETFKKLHPLVVNLQKRVKDFQSKARSREVRYFASKLYQDVSDMELRFWKFTI